ncbi:hypothetical protein TNCV_2064251 [Trichonephila clavipes]|nr:hypothetical protein TNCV_2064251 [Trichonephila clavipes]
MYGRTTAPTPQRCSASYSVYRKCVLDGCGSVCVKSDTTPNNDTGYRTSVVMHNAIDQQLLTTKSPNLNLTILMLEAEAGFVSKHNAVLLRCSCLPFIAPMTAQMPVVSSQG